MAEESSNAPRLDLTKRTENLKVTSKDVSLDVTNCIGSGGFGAVFMARHKVLGIVALKKMKEDVLRIPLKHEKAMLREVECLANLNHTNIVQLRGMVWEPNYHAILMEYMSNGDLETFLCKYGEEVIDWRAKAKFLSDISSGLYYIHSFKLFHNDLKANNVLLDDSLVAKISDFGLAEWRSYTTVVMAAKLENLDVRKSEKSRAFTFSHLCPERWKNIEALSYASDVYSFAILIWEVYSQETPFKGAVAEEIKLAVLDGQRPSMKHLPVDMPLEIQNEMVKCWDQDPAKRPPMSEVNEMLSKYSDNSAVSEVLDHMRKMKKDKLQLTNRCEVGLEGGSVPINQLLPIQRHSTAPVSSNDESHVEVVSNKLAAIEVQTATVTPQPNLTETNDLLPLMRSTVTVGDVPRVPGDVVPVLADLEHRRALTNVIATMDTLNQVNADYGTSHTNNVVCQPTEPVEPLARPRSGDFDSAGPSSAVRSSEDARRSAAPLPALSATATVQGETTTVIKRDGIKVIQTGNHNIIYIGPEQNVGDRAERATGSKTKTIIKKVRVPSGIVNSDVMIRISESLGMNWKHVARRLGLSDPDIQGLRHEFEREGLKEIAYQMLRRWSVQKGSEATYKLLAKALIDARMPELALSLEACRRLQQP